ncbi:MAG: hypothetical protein ACI4X9_05750 [Kiritimatiellia bacterium]
MKNRILLPALLLAAAPLFAALELPPYFADHMILQRDRPNPVWGRAEPGSTVTLQFAGQTKQTRTAPDGTWRLALDPLPASDESRTMTIRCDGQTQTVGEDKKELKDILVGEVVLVAGHGGLQHILGWGFDGWKAALAAAQTNRLVRQFRIAESAAEEPLQTLKGRWLAGRTIADVRSHAYYLGVALQQRLRVPVATLAAIHPKARLASWCAPKGYQGIPELQTEAQTLATRSSATRQFQDAFEAYAQELDAWKRTARERSAQGLPVKRPPKIKPAYAMARDHKGNVLPTEPTATWNAMLAPARAIPASAWIFLVDSPETEKHPLAKPYFTALLKGWEPAAGEPSRLPLVAPYVKAKTFSERAEPVAETILKTLAKGTDK